VHAQGAVGAVVLEGRNTITIHLLGAFLAGGLIGLERSFHGRPAGFRTHTLVCVTSSLLMLVTVYQWTWLPGVPLDTVKTDPTWMAQGIMTGIGFLGAGVIYKEGATVRGLTTPLRFGSRRHWHSVWDWLLFSCGLSHRVLLGFSPWFGGSKPACRCRCMPITSVPSHQNATRERSARHAVPAWFIANMSYRIMENGETFEYRMVIRTTDPTNTSRLADDLRRLEIVREFRISPTGD
jgi:putative Mg2+ transporter-C (MgtC) family protein